MDPLLVSARTDVTLSHSPINPKWVQSGAPIATSALLDRSADGMAFTVVWECTPGRFEWRYDIDETIHILKGSILLETDAAPTRRFGPGSVVSFKKGAVARWQVEETVRKLAFCRRAQPKPLLLVMQIKDRLTALTARGGRAEGSGGLIGAGVLGGA